MGFIDITGVEELRALHEEVRNQGIQLALMYVDHPVMEVLKSSGFLEEMDPGLIIDNRGKAVTALFQELDHDYCKNVCPYELFFECSTVK